MNEDGLNEDGLYRLATAVMSPPGHGAYLDQAGRQHHVNWLRGPCGGFWCLVMGLDQEQVIKNYHRLYGTRGGITDRCPTGHR